MNVSKFWACTTLCWLLALPFANTQNMNTLVTVNPKWEFGLRGGAGFNLSHLVNQQRYDLPRQYFSTRIISERPNSTRELYMGAYATRYFNNRWSLRSELSLLSTNNNGPFVTVGLFPRYKLTNWLSLEAGLEVTHTLSKLSTNGGTAWFGAAVGNKNLEFNVRYSPNYEPSTQFGRGGWNHTIQAGVGIKLLKVSNLVKGKKG